MNDIQYLIQKKEYTFDDLVLIMKLLRSENGCPWDREQTHKSIRNNFIEEVYEAVEGIDTENEAIMREELGDVMLQVVFHARISEEYGSFDINCVTTDICKKLIHRHPHIFAEVQAETSEQVLENWNEIKKQEKGQKTLSQTLSGISRSLPALMRGEKIASKLKKANQPVPGISDIQSLSKALESDENNSKNIGKLLYAVCAYASSVGVDCENALYDECEKITQENK